jgi:hypothetical protein
MYQIEEQEYLNQLIKAQKGEFIEQSKIDKSIKFKLNNSKIIIFPCKGNKGIIFSSEAAMNNTYSLYNGWPIEDNLNPFVNEKNSILLIPQNGSKFFIEKLNKELDFELLISDNKEYLYGVSKLIRKLIQKYKNDRAYNELYLPIGIYCCNIIFTLYKSEWFLNKEYGINPYYEPCIKLENGRIFSPWRDIFTNLKYNTQLSIFDIIEPYLENKNRRTTHS